MSCNNPTCEACTYNKAIYAAFDKHVHQAPITVLQLATLRTIFNCIESLEKAADDPAIQLLRMLGDRDGARNREIDSIVGDFMEEPNRIALLYAAFIQLVSVYAEKVDWNTLNTCMVEAFRDADEATGDEFNPAECQEAVDRTLDNFKSFLEKGLTQGRMTIQARADEAGVRLPGTNLN